MSHASAPVVTTATRRPADPRVLIPLSMAALYVIWGSTYLGIRYALESYPPFLLAGTRFLCAGTVLYGFLRMRGMPAPSALQWRNAAFSSVFLLGLGNGLVCFAEQRVGSGIAAVIVATVPIYIVVLSWLFGMARRPSAITWVGLAGGFVGVGILIGPALHFSGTGAPSRAWIGITILLFSSLIWSAGSLYSRTSRNAPSPFLAAGQQMLCGGTLLILAGLLTGESRHFDPHRITAQSLGAFIYLVLIGGIIGYASYAYLLRYCDPAKVATYAYVNPIVAVLLGAIFAHETLSLHTAVAAGLIIGSVALVITAQQFMPRSAPPNPVAISKGEKLSSHA